MNKSELVQSVAEKTSITRKDAEKTVNTVFEVIEGTLANNEKVQLIGFGSFEVRERAGRTGRNPKNGEPIEIAAAKVPSFKAGKALKDAVQ